MQLFHHLSCLLFNPTDSLVTFAQQLESDALEFLNIDGQTVAYTVYFLPLDNVTAHLFLWCDRQHTPVLLARTHPRCLSLTHPHNHTDPQWTTASYQCLGGTDQEGTYAGLNMTWTYYLFSWRGFNMCGKIMVHAWLKGTRSETKFRLYTASIKLVSSSVFHHL